MTAGPAPATCRCDAHDHPCAAQITAEDLLCDDCRGDECVEVGLGIEGVHMEYTHADMRKQPNNTTGKLLERILDDMGLRSPWSR